MVRKVSCGDTHSAIMTMEGYVYTFGSSQGGKLGHHGLKENDIRTPTLVEDFLNFQGQRIMITDICCANSFTVAVSSTG